MPRDIDAKMLLVKRNLSLNHWPSPEIHIIEIEREELGLGKQVGYTSGEAESFPRNLLLLLLLHPVLEFLDNLWGLGTD